MIIIETSLTTYNNYTGNKYINFREMIHNSTRY